MTAVKVFYKKKNNNNVAVFGRPLSRKNYIHSTPYPTINSFSREKKTSQKICRNIGSEINDKISHYKYYIFILTYVKKKMKVSQVSLPLILAIKNEQKLFYI